MRISQESFWAHLFFVSKLFRAAQGCSSCCGSPTTVVKQKSSSAPHSPAGMTSGASPTQLLATASDTLSDDYGLGEASPMPHNCPFEPYFLKAAKQGSAGMTTAAIGQKCQGNNTADSKATCGRTYVPDHILLLRNIIRGSTANVPNNQAAVSTWENTFWAQILSGARLLVAALLGEALYGLLLLAALKLGTFHSHKRWRHPWRCSTTLLAFLLVVLISSANLVSSRSSSLQTPHHPAPLVLHSLGHVGMPVIDSGFDSKAHDILVKEYNAKLPTSAADLATVVFPYSRASATVLTHGEFWSQVTDGHWEPATYKIFSYYLNSNTYLVDFGVWIGPTLLYGGQLAKRTYGVEADPSAFAECSINIKLNTDTVWYERIHLQPGCVSFEESGQIMHSAGAGNSMSSIGHFVGESPTMGAASWGVRCYTLPQLFAAWGINSEADHIFIKVDVESFECSLIPSWYIWFKGLSRRPTVYLSLHAQIHPCTEQEYEYLVKLIRLFKFTNAPLSHNGTALTSTVGEYVISDMYPPLL